MSTTTAQEPEGAPQSWLSHAVAIFLGVCIIVPTFVMFNRLKSQTTVDAVDASACFALFNTAILLDKSGSVPSTEAINGALALGPQPPVPVRVVRRSDTAVGVELDPSDAKAYPELARAYETVTLSDIQNHGLTCPHSPGAKAWVKRLYSAYYGS